MTEITQPYRSVRRTYSWGREWIFSGNSWVKTHNSQLAIWAQNRRIPVHGNNPTLWGNEQTMEVLREENNSVFVRGWTNNNKDVNWKCVSLQHSRGRVEFPAWVMAVVFPQPFWSQPRWSVRVGEDWQSCHPTPKTINYLNHQHPFFNESGWNKTGEEDTWVFLPHWPRFDKFPTLILVKIMPLSI